MEMTRIYSTSNPAQVTLIKHALATADIPFRITNESLLFSLGVAGMGNAGSDICVAESDAEKAKAILCSFDLVCG